MEYTCQRCGQTIASDAAFCPYCAAPQLRWIQPDPEPTDPEAGNPSGSSPANGRARRSIHWSAAIRLTVITALVSGLLCSILSPGTLLWVCCGAGLTVLLYTRRHSAVPPPPRLAARIGSLFGLLTAIVFTAVDAAMLLYQRYVLHLPDKFDQAYNTMLTQFAARAPASPDAAHQWAALIRFWHLPEARAGLYIFSAAFLALLTIMLSAAAAALTARFSNARHPRPGNA